MNTLPPELILQIAQGCTIRTLARLAQTCHGLRELLRPHLQRRLALSFIVDEDKHDTLLISNTFCDAPLATYLLWAARHPHPIHIAQAQDVFTIARAHKSTAYPYYTPWTCAGYCQPQPDNVNVWLNPDGTLNVYALDHLRLLFQDAALSSNIGLLNLLLDELTLRPPTGVELVTHNSESSAPWLKYHDETGGSRIARLFIWDGRIVYNAAQAERSGEVVKLLVERAGLDISGLDLTSIVYDAVTRGLTNVIRLLLRVSTAGRTTGSGSDNADDSLRTRLLAQPGSAGPDDMYYLQVAGETGRVEILELLIDEGGWDVNGRCGSGTLLDKMLLAFRSRRPRPSEGIQRDEFDARMRRTFAALIERGAVLDEVVKADDEGFLFG